MSNVPSYSFGNLVGTPYYEGLTLNPDVPGLYDVGLAGRGYMIDPKQSGRAILPRLRDAQDTEATPGEASLSTKGLWHRIQRGWQLGQGQRMFDSSDDKSDRRRYWRGLNMDPWVFNQMSMLNSTAQNPGISITDVPIALVVGLYFYVAITNTSTLKFNTDPSVTGPAWQTVTGLSGTITALTTDGLTVYIATTTGMFTTPVGSTVATQLGTVVAKALGYVNGRLLASVVNVLSEIGADGTAVPIAGGTHRNPAFVWSVYMSSPEFVYVSGAQGDRSEIYRMSVDQTTGAFNAPIGACTLPAGETLLCAGYNAGIMWLGTSVGVRKAAPTISGQLQYGRVITTGSCLSMAFQGNYVWFTWNTYLDGYLGAGRAHAGDETDTLVPVYASDIMTPGSALVYQVCRHGSKTYFLTSSAMWCEGNATTQTTGWFDTGWIDFGLPYPKALIDIDLVHQPLDGTIQVSVIDEAELQHDYGLSQTQGSLKPDAPIPFHADHYDRFRLRFTFTANAGGIGPVLLRWTLRAKPTPPAQDQILLAILMGRTVQGGADHNQPLEYNTWVEYDALRSLSSTRQPVFFQMGYRFEEVTVEDLQVKPNKLDEADTEDPFFDSTFFVTLNTLVPE